jgi:hypothetical protein
VAREIEAEHETREPKNQPVQPALPVAQRPGGHEDHQREEELELRQPGSARFVRSSIANMIAQTSDVNGARNRERSAEIAARIVRILLAPLLHQLFEFGVLAVRQHDLCRDVEIARRRFARQPLPLSRKTRPLDVLAGMESSTAPSSVGTRTFAPSTAS